MSKYSMRIDEITDGLQTFIATVRVANGSGFTAAKTAVHADGLMQARAILIRIFGDGNVLAVVEAQQQMTEIEEGTKTLSASELRVKSLADNAMKLKDQKKQEVARQSLAKAQQRMAKANNPKHASF